MGTELKDDHNVIKRTEIVNLGEKLILPTGMKAREAIKLLKDRMEYEAQKTTFSTTYRCTPFDGAHALMRVLEAKFGWAQQRSTMGGFFGMEEQPPQMISVENGYGTKTEVPWGAFSIPGVEGRVETQAIKHGGTFIFALTAEVLRMHEQVVREIMQDVTKYLVEGSIYKGKAMRISFLDDNGKVIPMLTPKFMDTASINKDLAVYPEHIQASINTNLFTPIVRARDCIANGIPVKRGVLLGGTYGTGKTLAATIAAKLAQDAGITYIYVPRADQLAMAIEFAKQYQSPACVVFCEDIDRVTAGERSVAMDDILNIIDGIDSKTNNIIVVLTTNHIEKINPAMIRPGRLDAVIEVTPPDARAVEKLIRVYGGATIDVRADLSEAGKVLAGSIPAVVAEVVKRAKLSQLALLPVGEKVLDISQDAILEAAHTMKGQLDLMHRLLNPGEKVVPPLDEALTAVVHNAMNGMREKIQDLHEAL